MGVYWSRVAQSPLYGAYAECSNKTLEKIRAMAEAQYPYLQAITESVLIADCSKADCPIIYANDSFEKMTLYPKEEILGKNCRFLQGPHTNPETVQRIRQAVVQGCELEVEILNYRKDGVAFWNHFLMLPLHKRSKCRYLIAIQKNVTTIRQGNHPSKWTPAELAMWLELYGMAQFSQRIIETNLSGKRFLRLSVSRMIKLGVLLRSEQEDLLKASSYLQQHIEQPFEEFRGSRPIYQPSLDAVGTNKLVNTKSPSELQYWDTGTDNSLLFKVYHKDQIFMLLLPRHNVSLDTVHAEVCKHFGLKQTRLSHFNLQTKETTVVYTAEIFSLLVKNETGTVKLYAEEEEKDLLALTSLLYSAPDCIAVINDSLQVLYANLALSKLIGVSNACFLPAADQLFPELPVDFPKYSKIRTVMQTAEKDALARVKLSISVCGEGLYFLIVRPCGWMGSAHETPSFRSLSRQETEYNRSGNVLTESESADSSEENGNSPVPVESLKLPGTDQPSLVESEKTSSTSSYSKHDPQTPRPISDADKQVLVRTLDQILTKENQEEPIQAFVASFKLFYSQQSLLEELLAFGQYYLVTPDFKQINSQLVTTIETNLLLLLETWVKWFPQDFKVRPLRKTLLAVLEQLTHSARTNSIKLLLISDAQKPRSAPVSEPSYFLELVDEAGAQDIANVLCYQDFQMFSKISPLEFVHCAWMKPDKATRAPNIHAMSQSYETFTKWLACSLLVSDARVRVKRIQKFIDIACRLVRRNNFQSLMAIISGLDQACITRLKRTWEKLPEASVTQWQSIRELMDPAQNFGNYRRMFQTLTSSESQAVVIPCMPVVLRDVAYFHESREGGCTMENLECFGKLLRSLKLLQIRPFSSAGDEITVKQSVLMYFSTLRATTTDEDYLYEMSLKIEPLAK